MFKSDRRDYDNSKGYWHYLINMIVLRKIIVNPMEEKDESEESTE